MKTINITLSKKLIPYLKNIDTKFYYEDWFIIHKWWVDIKNYKKLWLIKTLTLEEAIEFILKKIGVEDSLQLWNNYIWFFIKWELVLELSNFSLLQAIEKILEYLLDNKKLWTQK